MQRQRTKDSRPGERFKPKEGVETAVERSDMARLMVILNRGFGVAGGYSTMNRDRYYVVPKEGVSNEALLKFCESFLKGSPMPGTDPIADGPVLKRMFEAAKQGGLVDVNFVEASSRFVPERKADI